MKYISKTITLQEVPNEVSLSYLITGCQLKCKGCHSPGAWNGNKGTELTVTLLEKHLEENEGMITCVLFLGGEWEEKKLISLLKVVRDKGLKTCLYSGENNLSNMLIENLDYMKLGPYIKEFGALTDPNTNQEFINVNSGEDLTYYFNNKNKHAK